MYLDNEELLRTFVKEKIYVYGAGEEAKIFCAYFSDKLNIGGFIVSNPKETTFEGYPVYSNEICAKDNIRGKIVIVTSKYENEISQLLDKMGLISDKDYFKWDKSQLGNLDVSCIRLIKWNKTIWKEKLSKETDKKILIPLENICDSNVIYYAYLTDYLCNEYRAEVECYIRNNNEQVCHAVKELYESFGVRKIIYPKMTKEQKENADAIFIDIWNNIQTFEDWEKISIYGICFGTTIIRSYLRFKQPGLEARCESFKEHLYECVKTIVFWYDKIMTTDYKVVVLWDGAHWEGFIRDIAISKGIQVYATTYSGSFKLDYNFITCGKQYRYYKLFWDSLSEGEKKEGIIRAKKVLMNRINGKSQFDSKILPGKNPYALEKHGRVLSENTKIKIMIAMHIFGEDSYPYGNQIFDNNLISWLVHLGELSNKLLKYDWYIKAHPHGDDRDETFLNNYLKKYSNIKRIDKMVSPLQLRDEGLNFVLTVHGTVGSEYPLFGIQVINAGENPHIAFDFDWNPKSKNEYDALLDNLENINNLHRADEIYKFFAIDGVFYNHEIRKGKSIFDLLDNKEIGMWDRDFEVRGLDKTVGSWKFDLFLNEITDEKHKLLCDQTRKIFEQMNTWQPDIFYKKN